MDHREKKFYTEMGVHNMSDILEPQEKYDLLPSIRTPEQWLAQIKKKAPEDPKWAGHAQAHASAVWGDSATNDIAIARANKLHAAIRQLLPGIKAYLRLESIKTPPEKGEIRALETDEGWKYGAYLGTTYGYLGIAKINIEYTRKTQ